MHSWQHNSLLYRSSLLSTAATKRAFTLIEVLVVVAIIALLVAILLPSLARARFQAKLVVCKTNLEQIGRASHMYAGSYKDWFPITKDSGEDTFYALWRGRLLPNLGVLIDPATQNIIRPETLKWPEPSAAAKLHKDINGVNIPYQLDPVGLKQSSDVCSSSNYRDDIAGGHSYEYNGCWDESSKPWPLQGQHKKITQFLSFQSQIALANDKDQDVTNVLFGGDAIRGAQGCSPSRAGNGNNCPQPWDNHGAEGMNILFGDGHAEWARKVEGDWDDKTALAPGDPFSFSSRKHSMSAVIDIIGARSSHPWNYLRH